MSDTARLLIVGAFLLAGCGRGGVSPTTELDALSQPRGLSRDGATLCVAEAGAIGSDGPTREQPGQLEARTGRVLCTTDGAEPIVLVDGLPFIYYPEAAVTSGATDVLHDDNNVWVLIGESNGRFARSIVGVGSADPEVVADLGGFAEARSSVDGAQLRSNPYAMVLDRNGDGFLISDAASGQILRVEIDGTVSVFAPVAGHEVLTGMAWGPDGRLYVASFGQLPHPKGSGAIVAVGADGASRTVLDELTMPIDVGFDPGGNLFILEYSSPPDQPEAADAYRDGTGRLLRLPASDREGPPTVVLDRLDRPTALLVGQDALWISLAAREQGPGEGSVIRLELPELDTAG